MARITTTFTDVEAQDIEKDKVYSNGTIVFKVAKVRAWGDYGTVITTKRGNRQILHNNHTVSLIETDN